MRVLEESLRVLATEHHDLEESIASRLPSNSSSEGLSLYNTPANSFRSLSRPRRFYPAGVPDDEFYDAFSQGQLNKTWFNYTLDRRASTTDKEEKKEKKKGGSPLKKYAEWRGRRAAGGGTTPSPLVMRSQQEKKFGRAASQAYLGSVAFYDARLKTRCSYTSYSG